MKFVMSNRRAGKFREQEKMASRDALSAALALPSSTTHMLSDLAPPDDLARRSVVMEGTEGEMQALAATSTDDVIVEPLIMHERVGGARSLFAGTNVPVIDLSHTAGSGLLFEIEVRGGGRGLPFAGVTLFLRALGGDVARVEGMTDASGIAVFDVVPSMQPLAYIVSPYDGFWSRQVMVAGPKTTVVCDKLPGNRRIDWWHRAVGVNSFEADAGDGIAVGVIDTGFGPHPHLIGTDHGAFIDNQHDPVAGADVDIHGSHVAGSIGGRPGGQMVQAGVAPGVDLHSARVFPPDSGASNVDIANAIDHLSKAGADLINMSLGSPVKSELVEDAVQDAAERGTLCLCAAANDGGPPVKFPAALSETVAISAAGKIGTAPDTSTSGNQLPQEPWKFGLDGFFLARFSNFGPEIDAIAPGVGIIATVPERHGFVAPYSALDGTSMATPVACATLARVLAKDAAYLSLPRNIHRSNMARHILTQICVTIGLAPEFQGHGMPRD